MPLMYLPSTQKDIAAELERGIEENSLSQSLLFYGPPGSSKLTAAFDLAFLMMDANDRRSMLSTGQIAFLPSRDLGIQLKAAVSLFRNQRSSRSRIFFIQSVRTALMQYHAAFSSIKDSGLSCAFADASEVDVALYAFEEERDYSESEINEITALVSSKIVNERFLSRGRKNGASIDEIRAIQDWFSSGSDEKFAVIENIEDASDGAKNSLLKVLEEPDEHCHIILLSSSGSRMLPTLLSRVRKFRFPELSSSAVSGLVGSLFSIYGSYSSIDMFLFQMAISKEEREAVDEGADKYVEAFLSSRMLPRSDEASLFALLDRLGAYGYFRKKVVEALEKDFISKGNSYMAMRKKAILSDCIRASQVYNLPIKAALDLALREASVVE